MFQKAVLRRFIHLLVSGAAIFLTTSACKRGIDQQALSLAKPLAEECRIIQHAMGETCVPIQPHRVVTLDIFSLGNSITLGVQPIGGSYLRQEGELPEYLKNDLRNTENVGAECQPDMEKIILLKPDLILGRVACAQSYPLFSKVAPTVLSDWYIGTHWRENFAFSSNVLGKESSAEAEWNQYHARIEKLRSILTENYKNKKISVIGPYLSGVTAFTKNSFSGTILNDLQLQRPESQDFISEYGYVEISEEELTQIDSDILFIMIGNNDDRKLLEELKRKPLWRKLKVTQSNQVYVVKNHIWWGGNLIAANLVLDDIEKYLINAP
jgi:iron complex transport system substrate-binding protein